MVCIIAAVALGLFLPVGTAWAQNEIVVETPSRGVMLRALVIEPANPVGSVILLAGGHGNLALGKDGSIGWGSGNQLVRTRRDYARAGFVTIVPDASPDMKQGGGVKSGYRWSSEFATDIGAWVKHARGRKAPVHLVGTSRAALTVAKVGTQVTGEGRPDTLTITAGMIVHVTNDQPSAERNVGNLGRITQPTLLLWHAKDACAYTPASSAERAKKALSGASKVDVVLLSGGSAGSGNPCEAKSHHGFLGIDDEVVRTVTAWLKANSK